MTTQDLLALVHQIRVRLEAVNKLIANSNHFYSQRISEILSYRNHIADYIKRKP